MLCQDCHEKIANILFTQIVNNKKTVLHLCNECAQKRGIQITGEKKATDPINDFLAGMVDEEEAKQEGTDKLACATCGLTYKEFRQSGKLGCAECYATFNEPLKKLLRKIHGNTIHHGKQPAGVKAKAPEPEPDRGEDLEGLKKQLADAIKGEEFEKAAELRDRIKSAENKNNRNQKDKG